MMKSCAQVVGAIALAALSAACASTGAVPRPFPMPGSTSSPQGGSGSPQAGSAAGSAGSPTGETTSGRVDPYVLVGTALDLRGVRYREGGADPSGFDCSGFTQYVFAQHGVKLPRGVRDQFSAGKAVRPEELEAGDLLFFTTGAPGASHVAIAVGGDGFVHAPSSTGVVRVERLTTEYWVRRFVGVRRVL